MPHPPKNPQGKPIRERILLYGPPKVGKTHQFLNLARWHQSLGSDAMFYVISTDTSYEVLLMNPEFEDLENVEYVDVIQFQEYINAGRDFTKRMTSNDWLCVDLLPDAWAAVQDEYAATSAKASGVVDLGDLWATTGPDDTYPIGGWDWGMPNARYRIFSNNILLRCPGHVFLVAGQRELMKDSGSGKSGEARETMEMFKHIGLKPTGQKDDPFRYHSIINVTSGKEPRTQLMATAGERFGYRRHLGKKMSNGQVRGEEVEDFFMHYLVGIAKWTM